jgi:hypothetical protein
VRHRSILLRVAHGEVYTKERLFRFGMIDSPNCQCGVLETLAHKIYECEYPKRIWNLALKLTDGLKRAQQHDNVDPFENRILGVSIDTDPLILSIHGELLSRILALKDEDNYRLTPRALLKSAINTIAKNEKCLESKTKCLDLLSTLENTN